MEWTEIIQCRVQWEVVDKCLDLYEGESHENLKYILSRNLLNTKGTQFLHFSMLYRTATCRPLFKPSESLLSTYKTIELWFEFLSHF